MRKHQSLFAAAAFGALSGGRSVVGPALLALERKRRKGVFAAKRIGRVARMLEAAAAVGTTFALHRLRGVLTNRLRVPNPIAGALEDALVIGLGSRLASRVA